MYLLTNILRIVAIAPANPGAPLVLVTANLFRRPPRRDDLIRRAARELRHMVEFEDKGTNPRGG
ncbi:MAG: hypothetical protein ACM3IH_18895, partial [Sphingobacteriales bacterium]